MDDFLKLYSRQRRVRSFVTRNDPDENDPCRKDVYRCPWLPVFVLPKGETVRNFLVAGVRSFLKGRKQLFDFLSGADSIGHDSRRIQFANERP